MYLQRLRYGASKVTHQQAYHWATKGSAKLLGRGDIGEIAVGKQADLALFKLRSEEHTSELQSQAYLVCRLLLEKKKQKHKYLFL